MSVALIVVQLITYYQYLLIAYILMSWFRPSSGLLADIYRALGTIAEPWLGIFRRFVPPLGMIDISPIVAFFALRIIQRLLVTLLFR